MEDEAIETIRETSRNLLVLNRRKHRDQEADIRRPVTDLRVCSDTVTIIANKLKTKSVVSLNELLILKNTLVDDAVSIEVVLHTHGALRGLVREMTGNDSNKKCAAANCCCNLALGDARAGLAVTKAAGPYLVAALDNQLSELAVTCAWTLGNLAGSGSKACMMLTAQGAVAKLTEMLITNNEDTRDAALYALVHFTYQLQDDLRTDHLHKLLGVLPTLDIAASSQLYFILTCHKDFTNEFVTEGIILKIFNFMLSVSSKKSFENPNIMYVFRILANINSEEVYNAILSFILSHSLSTFIKKLINTDKACDSVLWFLGNAYKCCSNHVLFKSFR